jgi:transcriptional regulator with XRE-family HTH domain
MTSAPDNDPNPKNLALVALGVGLKKIRIAAGMSQADLAFAAEIDRTVISKIEVGNANPSYLTLENICQALHVTLVDLFKEVSAARLPSKPNARRANAAKPARPVINRRLR